MRLSGLTIGMMMIATLVAMTVALPNVARAEPVQIRTGINPQGSRIALIWQAPVAYEAELSGTELRLSFNRPIEADLSTLTANIPAFVAAAREGDNGLQLVLSLTRVFDLVHYPIGSTIVIDLIDPSVALSVAPAAEPAAEPATESVAGASGPQVSLRAGLHEDKLRVVFDWPQKVPYSISRNNDVVSLAFDSPATMDISELPKIKPDTLGDARYRTTQQASVVELAVANGASVQDFYVGNRVVLDIIYPTDGSAASRLPGVFTPVPAPSPAPESVAVSEPDAAVAVSENLPEDPPEDSTEQISGVAEVSEQVETPAAEPVADTSAGESPTDLGAADVAPVQNPVQNTDGNAPQGTIESSATATESGFTLRFDWDEPVAASVFRRGSALWIVFDKFAAVDTAAIQAAAGDQLLDFVQLPHPVATVLRAVTAQGVNPIPRREGLAWVFDFSKRPLSTQSPIEATVQPDSPVGVRVFLPVPEPGKAVPLVDPELGDNFITVPLVPPGYGFTDSYEYPQFRIRPSSQGVVIEPRVDTLRIQPGRQGVGISSTRTLHVSPPPGTPKTAGSFARIVDFGPLKNVTADSFIKRRQELERTIVMAPNLPRRTKERLELVRFYLAHGYGAEALGVLRVLSDQAPDAKKRADYHLYSGMGNYLTNHLKGARKDLEYEGLDNNDEGTFWRTLVEFSDGNEAPDVMRGLRDSGNTPEPYPRALRIPLFMRMIEAALTIGDSNLVRELIETLSTENLTPVERSKWHYLSGLRHELVGDNHAAIESFNAAIGGEDRRSRIFAARARIEIEHELGFIPVVSAIDGLETLRFAWRGGDFEFELLQRLGDLYLSQGAYRRGLTTLRQVATYFRDRDDAKQITLRMLDTFSYLFLKDGADRLPPITAIALYEEFKELTPAGEKGDQMIRKLADRLVSVDLLDEAGDLLWGQVAFRLKGTEKARVGAQLAVVRLLAKDYENALKALDVSDEPALPEELALERAHLRSRALAGLGQTADALELLRDDRSPNAEQLRVEQYWMLQDWPRAARALGRLLSLDGVKANTPLEPEQALKVLNYTIALTLSGNDRGLTLVRQRYGDAMMKSDLKDAFVLLATPDQFGLISLESIPSRIQVAENFQTFLMAYKKRLEEQRLSEIN